MGILLPFMDGLKLFQKETLAPRYCYQGYYFLAPFFMFLLMFLYWGVSPYKYPVLRMPNGSLFFLSLLGRTVYRTFLAGYSSKSKYAHLGAIRAAAQSISFEVAFFFLVLRYVILWKDLGVRVGGRLFAFPMAALWLMFLLVELGRAPFDFPECERELVSGYHLEYGGPLFVVIFLREYGFLLFFSSLFSQMFLGWSGAPCFVFYLLLTFCVFLRSCLPRYRYDALMGLFWQVLLPVSMLIVLFYYTLMLV
jgi:NADH-quinone oxidoreductase subunit H